jgi:hypothetical protein
VVTWSDDGGESWTQVAVPVGTACTGGPFDRATDPWLSFSPNGTLHAMSLVTDADPLTTGGFGDNGMTYNRSTDGGRMWEPFQLLIEDTNPRFLNDKNSITADPNDSRFVYAVWDRVQESGRQIIHPAHPIGLGFKGPIYFTRTTNGGNSWEPARKIYETGANKQTIGNQIVVEPAGEGGSLFDFFGDIVNASERRQTLGADRALIHPLGRQRRDLDQAAEDGRHAPDDAVPRGQRDRHRAGPLPRPERHRRLPDPGR